MNKTLTADQEKIRQLENEKEALRDCLRKMYHFTFVERWASKGLDDEAQKMHDLVTMLI